MPRPSVVIVPHSDNLEMATKENEHHRSEMVAMQKLSETQLSREVIRREKLEHQLQIIESSKAEIEQERDQLRAEADTLRGKPRKGAKGSVEPQAAADEPGDEDRSAASDRTDGPVTEHGSASTIQKGIAKRTAG